MSLPEQLRSIAPIHEGRRRHECIAEAADEIEQLTAERDRFREHSVRLNTLRWRLHELAGDVGPDDTRFLELGDETDIELLERVISKARAQ